MNPSEDIKTIRSGNGVGDNLYLQAIVRHLLNTTKHKYQVHTRFSTLFLQFASKIKIKPFKKSNITLTAHYTNRKGRVGTTQFQDMCQNVGIKEPVSLHLDWTARNETLLKTIKREAKDKKIVMVQLPREPFGRNDGYGREIMPKYEILNAAIEILKEKHGFYAVQVGSGKSEFILKAIDFDLSNKTALDEVFDIATISDMLIGQCSFFIPLAECFDRKSISIWSHNGLNSTNPFISTIRPAKILHKKTSYAIIDNVNREQLENQIRECLKWNH